jgi:ribosomal protein S18 acetylase RimI-like enzyme
VRRGSGSNTRRPAVLPHLSTRGRRALSTVADGVYNRRQNVLLLAEDVETGRLVGSCGVEAAPLTPEGRATPRLPTDAARMSTRPLLSNLVVDAEFRRRGVAKRLMTEAEAHACRWGFDHMLIKVERNNAPAEALYRHLGYKLTAEDTLAERPEPGAVRVRWVRTSNLVLRKDLSRLRGAMPPQRYAMLRGGV